MRLLRTSPVRQCRSSCGPGCWFSPRQKIRGHVEQPCNFSALADESEVPFAPLIKRLIVLLEQPISLASSGWLMLCFHQVRKTDVGWCRADILCHGSALDLFLIYSALPFCSIYSYLSALAVAVLQPVRELFRCSFAAFCSFCKIPRIFRRNKKHQSSHFGVLWCNARNKGGALEPVSNCQVPPSPFGRWRDVRHGARPPWHGVLSVPTPTTTPV